MNQPIANVIQHVTSLSFSAFRKCIEKEFKEEMDNTGFTLEELYMKDTQLCSKYEYSTRTKIKQCRIRLYNVLLEESQKHNLLFTDFQNILNIKDLIQWRMNNNK